MDVLGHWTAWENLEWGSRGVFKPGEYRAKHLKHEPGVYEMTDLVPASELRGAVDALRYIAGEDIAGYPPHMNARHIAGEALAKLGVEPYASRGQ